MRSNATIGGRGSGRRESGKGGLGVRVALGIVVAAGAAAACGQSTRRMAFVANNGDLEGSVTSYTFDSDGAPGFLAKFVTGAKATPADFHPGTNAATVALSPNGRYLLVTHTTSSTTTERITILRVEPNGTLTPQGVFQTPDSPAAGCWISDELLAVTRTSSSVSSEVIVYRHSAGAHTLTEVDRKVSGGLSAHFVLHPNRGFLYATDTTAYQITGFAIGAGGTLSSIGGVSTTPVFALAPCMTNDGAKLYACGGASNDANKMLGHHVDPTSGALTAMGASPFAVPSLIPKFAAASPTGSHLFVAHAETELINVYAINPQTGRLSLSGGSLHASPGESFSDMEVLDNQLLVTSTPTIAGGYTGLRSFSILGNGFFTPRGDIVDSRGVNPVRIAAWSPPPVSCIGCDTNCDGSVNQFDIPLFVNILVSQDPGCSGCAGDTSNDGSINQFDIPGFVACLTG